MNTNSVIWVLTELAHGIILRFQYGIMFGWQTMELHSTLFYMHQITISKVCDYKLNDYIAIVQIDARSASAQ